MDWVPYDKISCELEQAKTSKEIAWTTSLFDRLHSNMCSFWTAETRQNTVTG